MRLTVMTLKPFHWSITAVSRREAARARAEFQEQGLECTAIQHEDGEYAFLATASEEQAVC